MKQFWLLLALATSPALAQQTDTTDSTLASQPTDYAFGFLSEINTGLVVGVNNLPAYRAFLVANQIQSPPSLDAYLSIGLGVRFQHFHVLTQVGYSLLNSGYPSEPTNRSGLVSRQLMGGNVGFLIGYDLINARNKRLFLNVGMGGIGYEYALYRQTSTSISFQQLPQTTSPGSVASLKILNTYWDVNIDYVQREKRKRSVQLLFRLGYRRGFQPQRWTSDVFTLTDAPTDRISQVYGQVGYQFSSNRTKRTRP